MNRIKWAIGLLLFLNVFEVHSQTQGLFLNDHVSREIVIPASTGGQKPTTAASVSVLVDFDQQPTTVSKYLFGNNANIYMSQMVDQPVLLNHIKKLSPNVLRFPGGNLSSVYFWNAAKGQPPADAPTQILDADGQPISDAYWYGNNTDNWTLSVDNYYEMLVQTNSTGIITVNYGYARYSTANDPVASAAHLAAEWVRYDNGRTKFWEIGNESNGTWQAGHRINVADNKDGQPMIINGDLYGRHFKVFADSMRKAAAEVGATIFIGAQLLQEAPASWWNDTDKNWNAGVFAKSVNTPDFYIIHSYYTPFAQNSNAALILNSGTRVTKEMMEFVTKQQQDAGVTVKPVALTEWNIFAEGSKQQASYINGMHAVLVLGELMKQKYGLATRWDLVNGWGGGNDHGMFNSGDEPGGVPKWNPRAVFYYMYYFQKFTSDNFYQSSVTGSADVEAIATRFASGEAGLVLVNKGTTAQTVSFNLSNYGYGQKYYTYTLTGGTDNGEFSLKVFINGVGPTNASGGSSTFESIAAKNYSIGNEIKVSLPARSVQYILVEAGDGVITALNDDDSNQISVYPNHATNKVIVNLGNDVFSRVEILDPHGKVMKTVALNTREKTVELSTMFPPGIYFLRITGATKQVVKKIIIE